VDRKRLRRLFQLRKGRKRGDRSPKKNHIYNLGRRTETEECNGKRIAGLTSGEKDRAKPPGETQRQLLKSDSEKKFEIKKADPRIIDGAGHAFSWNKQAPHALREEVAKASEKSYSWKTGERASRNRERI